MKGGPNLTDRVTGAVGPGAVGEESDGEGLGGVDPKRGAGVAEMADGTGAEVLAGG